MKSLSTKQSMPIGVIIAVCASLLLVFATVFAATVSADTKQPANGERLITVHDNGKDKGILTKADTLREAFKEAGIRIDENDMVEPGLDEELVASNYEVNVYRARPVTIVDGAVQKKVMSPYRTAEQIVEQAGMTLQDEDTADMQAPSGMVRHGTGLRLMIDRATEFTLVLYGKKLTEYTQAATVGEMLQEKGITLGEKDELSVPKDTPITAGMTVELWRNGKQTVTVDEKIPFETEEIKDANREVGYREVKTPGVKGEQTVTYEIVMENGKEVSRKEIQSIVTKKPKSEVIIVGTKPVIAPYTGGGNKSEWMRAAGISEAHWGAVDYIVSQESGWNPNAVNPYSGACGLAQALPCSKVPGNPLDPVDSLQWMNGYVIGRYGSWEAAVSFKQANGWY